MRTIEEIERAAQNAKSIEESFDCAVELIRLLNSVIGSIEIPRLTEICQAEREGRLVVLPCNVGDAVWCTTSDQYDYINEPYECEVVHMDFDIDGVKLSIYSKKRDVGWGIPFKPDHAIPSHMNTRSVIDFGKTVFLAEEEAEAALKGVKHE